MTGGCCGGQFEEHDVGETWMSFTGILGWSFGLVIAGANSMLEAKIKQIATTRELRVPIDLNIQPTYSIGQRRFPNLARPEERWTAACEA